MDFFKAAFFNETGISSSKNSKDLENSDRDGTDGWDNQAEEWTFNEEINSDGAPRPGESDSNDQEQEDSGSEGGIWSFGSLVKTLTSKSEEVIQAYRRDLEEFGSGLKKETEVIREVASRAVKDLPNSLEVGASVAQESLESVGQVIDELGSSVWRGTADILAQGKDSISYIEEENASEQSSFIYSNVGVQRKYNRLEAQIKAMQLDSNTYCEEPEDAEDYEIWKAGFRLEEKDEEVEVLCRENVFMEEVKCRLVPKVVDYETFWTRYFYRLHKLRQAEEARADLVKRAIISREEEDLSWEVDDDDNVEAVEEKKKDGKIGEETDEKQPKIDHEMVETSAAREDLVEKPRIGEETVENLKTGKLLVEEPQAYEEIAEKPKTDANLAQKPNVTGNLAENPQFGEEIVDKAKIEDGIGEKSKIEGEIRDKTLLEARTDPEESSKSSDFSVVSSKPSSHEEDDLGWDEIEDLNAVEEKKFTVGSSPHRTDIRKRISIVEDDEDLSWDVDDDDDIKS